MFPVVAASPTSSCVEYKIGITCDNPTQYSVIDGRWKAPLTLKVLNFWKFTSYCSLKPLWSSMGEVVPARTSPTLHPSHCASIVTTSTVRVKNLQTVCVYSRGVEWSTMHSWENTILHVCLRGAMRSTSAWTRLIHWVACSCPACVIVGRRTDSGPAR